METVLQDLNEHKKVILTNVVRIKILALSSYEVSTYTTFNKEIDEFERTKEVFFEIQEMSSKEFL